MKLTAKFIETCDRPGRYTDSGAPGLTLLVQARESKRTGETTLRRSFVQRLTVRGKRVDIGLGSPRWGATTLTQARRTAIGNFQIARNGGDPRVGTTGVPSFERAAEIVIELNAAGWKDSGKSAAQWRASLRDYVYRQIGRKPVSDVTTADVMRVLTPIWQSKRETARRVRQRIGRVMQWAVAQGFRADNPAGDAISAALPQNGVTKTHHRALPHGKVGAALDTIRNSNAWHCTRLCLELIALTAVRSSEARLATWDEIDLDAGVWTIPAERMKARTEHRVPLSDRAIEIIREAKAIAHPHSLIREDRSLIFATPTGKALSDNTLSKLMRELKIGAVPHGFRSSFRDWCGETGVAREVAESALAHTIKNKAEASYARSDLLERRRDLMQAWAVYVAAGNVVPLRSAS